MFTIEVIPLHKGIRSGSLTYFSSESFLPGTLVSIPIQKRTIRGLVIGTESVSAAKTALRAATFSLRKLPPQPHVDHLSPALIRTAERLSERYATSLGSVLYHLLPPAIQRGDIELPHTHHIEPSTTYPPEVLKAHRDERFLTYRSLVRETFAHASSILIVVPTSVEAEELASYLSSGIEDRTTILTSTMDKRTLARAYTELEDFTRPRLIIATPSHAVLERHDIAATVIEHARSMLYRDRERPYLDYRDVIMIHASETGRRCILGDLLVRTEDEFFRREEEYLTLGENHTRLELPGTLEVITVPTERVRESYLSLLPETISAIRDTRKRKGRIFVFGARRGLAPIVMCGDCGYVFRSPQSGVPYSLVRVTRAGKEERWFVCSASGDRERAADTCPQCSSWRLRERGIGIQFVQDEFKKLLPDVPLILFDHTTATSYKRAQFLQETFYRNKSTIMLGTQMAIPYLTKPIDLSIVVNMDALLATPTWRLEEENLGILLALREVTRGKVLVQTRSPENTLLTHARHATIEQFYSEELAMRKQYNYPPYAVFIHLTWQGDEVSVRSTERDVRAALANIALSVYPSPHTGRNTHTLHALIRVPRTEWPRTSLKETLLKLPPSVRVVINPDRIV